MYLLFMFVLWQFGEKRFSLASFDVGQLCDDVSRVILGVRKEDFDLRETRRCQQHLHVLALDANNTVNQPQ